MSMRTSFFNRQARIGIIAVSLGIFMIPLSASAAYHLSLRKQKGTEVHLFHIARTQVVPRQSHRVLQQKVDQSFSRSSAEAQ